MNTKSIIFKGSQRDLTKILMQYKQRLRSSTSPARDRFAPKSKILAKPLTQSTD